MGMANVMARAVGRGAGQCCCYRNGCHAAQSAGQSESASGPALDCCLQSGNSVGFKLYF